ncbi:protein of unknown function [Methylorubrum extorquens DM4]|uniref:Uncharacterized protein n=1 Tax=Methylorubrum extorquens (strain DSM 6343 / CIP 106787 / DM4) TaxID=661410 RepID=C7CFV5_METED|nr:protein of unknown function [Methylorubrum extorquens DM4]
MGASSPSTPGGCSKPSATCLPPRQRHALCPGRGPSLGRLTQTNRPPDNPERFSPRGCRGLVTNWNSRRFAGRSPLDAQSIRIAATVKLPPTPTTARPAEPVRSGRPEAMPRVGHDQAAIDREAVMYAISPL